MNEEPVEKPVPGSEPVEKDIGQIKEKKGKVENPSNAAPAQEPSAPTDEPVTQEKPTSDPAAENSGEEKEEAKEGAGEPPVDWFEPLEEDEDANSDGRNDPEEESLAGESERSEGVPGGERANKRVYQLHVPRRKRSNPDEGWEEWPVLGEGWKRKEVVRRSGCSMGQKDVYYLSPRGDRVRSRVELVSVLEGQLDLTNFEYKTGKFCEGEPQYIRVRHRVKRKVRDRSSSESSWMDRGEGADTPDSYHRLTPNPTTKNYQTPNNQISLSSQTASSYQGSHNEYPAEEKIKLPTPSLLSKPLLLPAINGEIGSEDSTLVCARCGISFTGTWYDKQRKKPCCPTCWASSKSREHPMIRFRKWIPCGQCVGCHNTANCGQCANCKHGLQSPETRKRLCRKRKCVCPIRKSTASKLSLLSQKTNNDVADTFDDSMSVQSEVGDSQQMSLKSSDTENFSVNVDVDDEDDLSTDDDDDWHRKRKRRSCGECQACLCRKDCGTCDFCIDKPKFGGSNKKRQKCRLRQCQRQAMRHLLPFQMGQGDIVPDGALLAGRPRPHYTYSRKSGFKKNKELDIDLSEDDDDDSNFPPMSWSSEPASGSKPSCDLNLKSGHSTLQQPSLGDGEQRNGLSDRAAYISSNNNSGLGQLSRWDTDKPPEDRVGQKHVDEEEELPMITQIFSLADNTASSGADTENQLMKLLHSLRSSALPILWYAIMVEGPQLQLIQCSKQSSMADTIVLIDPGFCYQVTVQKQPLLPTHSLYDHHPTHLSSVTEVVNLLLSLEQYTVCHGLPLPDSLSIKEPIILERASTCDFLVRKNVSICANCKALQGP